MYKIVWSVSRLLSVCQSLWLERRVRLLPIHPPCVGRVACVSWIIWIFICFGEVMGVISIALVSLPPWVSVLGWLFRTITPILVGYFSWLIRTGTVHGVLIHFSLRAMLGAHLGPWTPIICKFQFWRCEYFSFHGRRVHSVAMGSWIAALVKFRLIHPGPLGLWP